MKLKHLFTPSRTKSTVLLASTILTLTPVTFITSSMPVYATEADTTEVDATERKKRSFSSEIFHGIQLKKKRKKFLQMEEPKYKQLYLKTTFSGWTE